LNVNRPKTLIKQIDNIGTIGQRQVKVKVNVDLYSASS